MNSIKKIISVDDNKSFSESVIENELIPAMILNYSDVRVAFLYIMGRDFTSQDKVQGLAKRANLDYRNGKLYDNDKELGRNFVLSIISKDLGDVVKKCEENNDPDYDYMCLELVKDVFLNEMLPRVEKEEVKEEIMGVEDLMAKLYGDKERGAMHR